MPSSELKFVAILQGGMKSFFKSIIAPAKIKVVTTKMVLFTHPTGFSVVVVLFLVVAVVVVVVFIMAGLQGF